MGIARENAGELEITDSVRDIGANVSSRVQEAFDGLNKGRIGAVPFLFSDLLMCPAFSALILS